MKTTQMRIDWSLFLRAWIKPFPEAQWMLPSFKRQVLTYFCPFLCTTAVTRKKKGLKHSKKRLFAMGLYSFTSASLSASPIFPWSRVSWSFSSENHLTKFQTYPIIHTFSLQEMCRVPFACLFLILFADMFKSFPTLTSLLFTWLQKIPFSFQN